MSDLDYTGERIVPGKADPILWAEHLARYLLAAAFVRGRSVLDAGCGAGYGADLLAARGARTMLGVDVAADAIEYARSYYRRNNLDYRAMSATALDLPDRSVEVVISFEVIEHLADAAAFVAEVARVLTEDGVFITSTPNRSVYRLGLGPNPFHTREFTADEFEAMLRSSFRNVRMFAQDFSLAVEITPVADPGRSADVFIDRTVLSTRPEPLYYIAVCSQTEPPPAGGVLVPFSRESPDDLLWRQRVRLALREMLEVVPPDGTFILVDEDQWALDSPVAGRQHVQFPERDGRYAGPPAEDTAAIRELERLRHAGAGHFVVAWSAFWWLEHYGGLHRHLRERYPCVLENDRLVVFDLRAHTDHP